MFAPRANTAPEHLISDAVLTWLPVDALEIDPEYQRRLRIDRVKDIIDHFNADAFGCLYVHYRPDGRYIVCDGQHRLSALRQMRFAGRVPCLLYSHRTIEWEASTFPDFNRERTNLTPFEVIKAEVRAGTPLHNRLMQAIEAAQFRLGTDTDQESRPYRVNCPALLNRIAEQSGPDMVKDILLIIRDAWQEDKDGPRADIVEGLWLFIHRYGLVMDRARLVEQLRRVAPFKLIRDAESLQATKRGSIAVNVARQIVERYNRGLRNRLPEWANGRIKSDEKA